MNTGAPLNWAMVSGSGLLVCWVGVLERDGSLPVEDL